MNHNSEFCNAIRDAVRLYRPTVGLVWMIGVLGIVKEELLAELYAEWEREAAEKKDA